MNSILRKNSFASEPFMSIGKRKLSVQPKLTVNTPGDIYEQEADAMADRVMRMSSNETANPVTGLIGKSLQRKCSHCEEEEKKRNPIMRKAEAGNAGMSVSSSFAASLNASKGGGSPLPQGTRIFMENAFRADFTYVRVHSGTQASEMSRSINAKAFTHGNDIYFNDEHLDVGSSEGKKLLAHELTHVIQQEFRQTIQKQPDDLVDNDLFMKKSRVADLKIIIERKFNDAILLKIRLRQEKESGPELESQLVKNREDRIKLLEESIGLISYLLSSEGATNDEMLNWINELSLLNNSLNTLKRWEKRQKINHVNTRIAAIDLELDKFTSCDGTGTDLVMERAGLLKDRIELARELTTTSVEYKQFDRRWGNDRYGKNDDCSSMGEGGCGPASLAMVLNFYELENPEGQASRGFTEIVLPTETAAYAEEQGRICGAGTNIEIMMRGVPERWEGYRGRKINIEEAKSELQNGRLVIFLCRKCKGQNARGKTKSYGGHYMVLNGVDDSGQIFNVLDSGRPEQNNIETIDLINQKTSVPILWTVDYSEL